MFKGLGGLGDIGKMMGQMRELQEKMGEVQQRIEALEVQGVAAGGMVTATVSGKGVLKGLSVDPMHLSRTAGLWTAIKIVTAVADAQEKAAVRAQEEMQSVTAGLPIPPGMMGGM